MKRDCRDLALYSLLASLGACSSPGLEPEHYSARGGMAFNTRAPLNDAGIYEASRSSLSEPILVRLPPREVAATREFGGISWGAGPSLTADWGKHDRVSSASVDPNGIVRVNDENNDVVRLTLETHYFFPAQEYRFLRLVDPDLWGWGPFVAIQAAEDEIVDALGFGVMFGFKYDKEKPSSFNVGLGVMVDPNAQVLGSGVKENQPLPVGETEIRFREESQWGFLLMFSFTF